MKATFYSLILVAGFADSASAITLVSNLAESENSANNIGSVPSPNNQFEVANAFTTGTNVGGYSLNSVTLNMSDLTGAPSGFAVNLYSEAGGEPSASILSLTGSNNPATAGQYAYTTGGFTLSANTTYFVVASADVAVAAGVNAYRWLNTSSTSETSSDGWTIDDTGFNRNSGTSGSNTWGSFTDARMFSVDADAVPEPSSAMLLVMTATGFCLRRKR